MFVLLVAVFIVTVFIVTVCHNFVSFIGDYGDKVTYNRVQPGCKVIKVGSINTDMFIIFIG